MANRHKKKMFKSLIIRNTLQNYSETSLHICQKGYHQKGSKITNVGEDVKKKEPLYTVNVNVN